MDIELEFWVQYRHHCIVNGSSGKLCLSTVSSMMETHSGMGKPCVGENLTIQSPPDFVVHTDCSLSSMGCSLVPCNTAIWKQHLKLMSKKCINYTISQTWLCIDLCNYVLNVFFSFATSSSSIELMVTFARGVEKRMRSSAHDKAQQGSSTVINVSTSINKITHRHIIFQKDADTVWNMTIYK